MFQLNLILNCVALKDKSWQGLRNFFECGRLCEKCSPLSCPGKLPFIQVEVACFAIYHLPRQHCISCKRRPNQQWGKPNWVRVNYLFKWKATPASHRKETLFSLTFSHLPIIAIGTIRHASIVINLAFHLLVLSTVDWCVSNLWS